MENIKVLKKDGSHETWSDDKIVTSIAKAGVPINEAENYAANIKNWAEENAKKGSVNSTEIRDKVILRIKKNYPAEAESYKTYKQ